MYIIIGQTSTGKTKLAYDLAKKHSGELISCDSRQIYKNLNIITGKEIFADIKTHLIDIVDPKEQFSSFDYAQLAMPLIKSLQSRGITPIIVGGSYLYLKHLLYGIDTNVPANWKLRDRLNKKSVKQLQDMLKDLDVRLFKQLNQSDKNNPHRLIRRIEIALRHSRPTPLSFPRKRESGEVEQILNQVEDDSGIVIHTPGVKKKNYTPGVEYFQISSNKITGLRFKDNIALKKAITKRVEQRIKDGALQEVKRLLKLGYKPTDPGLNTIGYKQLINHCLGTISKDRAIEQWITKEFQYAKRQYTFMKKNPDINWREV